MKKIKLSQGKYALVDDVDYEWLNKYKWYFNQGYAIRGIFNGKNMSKVRMHREVAKTPEGKFTDHINRNRLDNRRKNLRVVTQSQNMRNIGGIGYYFHKGAKKWQAQITTNYKNKYLGLFKSKKEARSAYLIEYNKSYE